MLFDYGQTLFDFGWSDELHARGVAAMLAALGADLAPEDVIAEFWPRFEAAGAGCGEHGEIDYRAVVADVLAALGLVPEPQQLDLAIRAEHLSWDDSRTLHPQTHELLDAMRAHGLRIGVVSNTFDPPELLHADLARLGVTSRVDAIVFSSELGVRKPHPRIYQEALARLGVAPEHALFVGDRVREDIEGPRALGMRTCLALYYRQDEGDHALADFRAQQPLDVVEIVRTIGEIRR